MSSGSRAAERPAAPTRTPWPVGVAPPARPARDLLRRLTHDHGECPSKLVVVVQASQGAVPLVPIYSRSMSKEEARQLLLERTDDLRRRPHADLLALREPKAWEAIGISGTVYHMEAEAFIEDRRQGHLRVLVSIFGGGVSMFRPMTDYFIVGTDGIFVGE
jgi:hypothetical protein